MLGRLRMPIQDCVHEFRLILESMFSNPRLVLRTGPRYWRQPKYDHYRAEARIKDLVRRNDLRFEERYHDGFFGSDPVQCKT